MYKQISSNKFKTYLLLSLFISFVMGVSILLGYLIGQSIYHSLIAGIIAFALSLLLSLFTYFFGDKIVLFTTGAVEVTNNPNFKELNDLVEILAIKAGIPKPRVYILPELALNAFATGRNPQNSHVALTEGLLRSLNKDELAGVIAHELAHIRNFDIRLMLILSVLAGTLTFIIDTFLRAVFFPKSDGDNSDNSSGSIFLMVIGIILSITLPIISLLIQLAISRRREFLADATAVEITRHPQGLISALRKIEASDISVEKATEGNAHMFFDNPFKDDNFIVRLFSTHPPIKDRIKALESMIL